MGDGEERLGLPGRHEIELEDLPPLQRRKVDGALRQAGEARLLPREEREADVEEAVAARPLELRRGEERRRAVLLGRLVRLLGVELGEAGRFAAQLAPRLVL